MILKSRWIQEQEDLLDDPTQIGELDSNANKRLDRLEHNLREQLEGRVASLEEMMKQQAQQSDKRLGELIALISAMQER